ncbi:hypothetical protein ACFOGJ_15670 [Marinibaculum pumilum]|uniref:Uncharacterized protein n=1 Tax=Marinibaculum pumilum TaxID=1766165 RepID=A0ABV7L250_9PROT
MFRRHVLCLVAGLLLFGPAAADAQPAPRTLTIVVTNLTLAPMTGGGANVQAGHRIGNDQLAAGRTIRVEQSARTTTASDEQTGLIAGSAEIVTARGVVSLVWTWAEGNSPTVDVQPPDGLTAEVKQVDGGTDSATYEIGLK